MTRFTLPLLLLPALLGLALLGLCEARGRTWRRRAGLAELEPMPVRYER